MQNFAVYFGAAVAAEALADNVETIKQHLGHRIEL